MRINNPKPIWQLSFEGAWPTSVAFLKDSNQLVAGNRDGHIYFWTLPAEIPKSNDKNRAPNVAPQVRLDGHTNGITHLIATKDGKTLISASLDHAVRIWDPHSKSTTSAEVVLDSKTRKQKARYKPAKDREKFLKAPGVKVNTITQSQTLSGHQDWVKSLGLSGDEKRLISGDDNCLSIVWELSSRKQVSKFNGYNRNWVTSAALSPDGKTAFTAEYCERYSSFDCPAANVRLWDADSGKQKLDLLKIWTPKVKDRDRIDSYGYRQSWTKLIKRGLVCATFSPDGKLIAVGQGGETDTGKVHIVEVASGKIVRTVSGHRNGICDVKISADGKYILSAGRDTTVRICQVSDGKEVATLGKSRGGQFKDWVHAIAISADQNYVAAADIAGYVHIWKLS